jgi:hypothetical protein
MDKSSEIICGILGEGHPVTDELRKVCSGESEEGPMVTDVFAAVFAMFIAEVDDLKKRLKALEDTNEEV